jgi:hypothetical protein
MSAATPLPGLPTDPDPPRAAPAMPPRIGRVLSLVRRLIDYGRQLAATAQQRAAAPDFARFAWPFGTADLAAILARITGGLRRAAALEASLSLRAARGQDLAHSPIRLPAAHTPRAPRQSAPSDAAAAPLPADPAQDPRLALMPTEAEIAALLRRRPVGAVIADICHEFGIMPGHLTREFWDEIAHAIIAYGGSLLGFVTKVNRLAFGFGSGNDSDRANPLWPAAPQRLPEPATGPP